MSFEQSLKDIKLAGFTHIKIELEAQLQRGSVYCGDCDNAGQHLCTQCENDGDTCDNCDSNGYVPCDYCNGESSEGFSDSDCQAFLLDNISPAAKKALTYGKFYNDGSVDSEYTFTLPIEKAHHAIEYIEAFKKLGYEVGNGLDVTGAGMHIATLLSGNYPTQKRLKPAGISNFIEQVTKLLPALYFIASSDHKSRSLHYRQPRISATDKYSAIYTRNNHNIEYRLFETCYDKPEILKDYIQVIAQTLKYYANPKLEVKPLKRDFEFLDNSDTKKHNLARFYNTSESLNSLDQTLKLIKPSKSIVRLKHERHFGVTPEHIKRREAKQLARYKAEYDQHCKQINDGNNQRKREAMIWIKQEATTFNITLKEAKLRYESRIGAIIKKPCSFKQYIQRTKPKGSVVKI